MLRLQDQHGIACESCIFELHAAKQRVRKAHERKMKAWNNYCTMADNRRARANQYEMDADAFQQAVAELIYAFKDAKRRH